MSINYSPTRHRALAAVAAGDVQRHEFTGVPVVWTDGKRVAYRENDVRALNFLYDDAAIDSTDGGNAVHVTADAEALLGKWDAQYPENLPSVLGPWRVSGSDADSRETVLSNDTLTMRVDSDDPRIAQALVARLNADPAQ